MKPLLLELYLGFSKVNAGLYRYVLKRRFSAGKEDPQRIAERWGDASVPRPKGKLVWFHAASVGETLSLDPVVNGLLEANADLSILVTSTTMTSAKIMAQSLPSRAIHQYSPIDNNRVVQKFLRYWKPDVAVWTESELWPALMTGADEAGIPMQLINGRVSNKTADSWRRHPKTFAYLLNLFDKIAVQEQATADVMTQIGVANERVTVTGGTKEDAAPLPFSPDDLAELKKSIGHRNTWFAGSTHPDEEAFVLEAHLRAFVGKKTAPLLIIAPRHPERGNEVAELIRSHGLVAAQRSKKEPISEVTQVYVADTIGEMGLWYRLSNISFVGGSLTEVGGHNPFEPVVLGSAVIHGPHTFNFAETYQSLADVGGCLLVNDSKELANAVVALEDEDMRSKMTSNAKRAKGDANSATSLVLESILGALT